MEIGSGESYSRRGEFRNFIEVKKTKELSTGSGDLIKGASVYSD